MGPCTVRLVSVYVWSRFGHLLFLAWVNVRAYCVQAQSTLTLHPLIRCYRPGKLCTLQLYLLLGWLATINFLKSLLVPFKVTPSGELDTSKGGFQKIRHAKITIFVPPPSIPSR